jgi:hypothetical protein
MPCAPSESSRNIRRRRRRRRRGRLVGEELGIVASYEYQYIILSSQRNERLIHK